MTPTATRTPEPSSSASAQENHQICFPEKQHTDGWRRESSSHCRNTKQCWNLHLPGILPLPRNLCVTSAPNCQVSWRARPPRCRRESKVSIPSTHTLHQKKSHTFLPDAVCKQSSFATDKKPRCAAHAKSASIGVAHNQRHCRHSFFRCRWQQPSQWWKQDAAW